MWVPRKSCLHCAKKNMLMAGIVKLAMKVCSVSFCGCTWVSSHIWYHALGWGYLGVSVLGIGVVQNNMGAFNVVNWLCGELWCY